METMSPALQECRTLVRAAERMIEAADRQAMEEALRHNMIVWTGIRAILNAGAPHLTPEVRGGLKALADYVAVTTMGSGAGLKRSQIQTLVELNMQVAQGLFDGEVTRLIQERAHQLWEAEGRPEGRAEQHWDQAEREIRGQMTTPM